MAVRSLRAAARRARRSVRRRLARSPVGERVAEATRVSRARAILETSGLFDAAFYRRQLPDGEAPADPIEHYLTGGGDRGLSPHPLFDRGYYLGGSEKARKTAADPFVEFVAHGCRRGDDPHPLFDTEAYLHKVPGADRHSYGAFGHFLATPDVPWPIADDVLGDQRGAATYLGFAEKAQAAHRAVPDYTGFRRVFDEFDHDVAADFVRRMRSAAAGIAEPPKVSVIIPTKDRLDPVQAAIASVRAQTYGNWELVVVDDGGTDRTGEVVRQLAAEDTRISYVHQPNTGVSGARNHGIRLSSGDYLAYLDSDNTWVPEFLAVMIAFIHTEGLRAAYCASELRDGDRTQYRGRPLHREALRERNYIDCITLVQERALVAEIGGFDEQLRRVVDWDLLIRLADATDLGYAPFIGTSYDLWDESHERISHNESVGYRFVVRDKHLVRWSEAPAQVEGRVSFIVSTRGRKEVVLASVVAFTATLADCLPLDHEIILVDSGFDLRTAMVLRVLEQHVPELRVVRLVDSRSLAVARNWAASMASGEVLVVLDTGVRLTADSVRRLVDTTRQGRGLVQPVIIDQDGTVRSAGQFLGRNASAIVWGHELPADDPILRSHVRCDGVDGFAFAVDATTFRDLHGMDPLFARGGSDLDLGLRAADMGLGTTLERDSVATLVPTPPNDVWSPDAADRAEFSRRWGHLASSHLTDALPDGIEIAGLAPLRTEQAGYPKRWMSQLHRTGGARRWAIKTSVPDVNVAHRWGDWHFAVALREALRSLGEDAVVDTVKAWNRRTASLDDINLVLRGTQQFQPNPGQLNILWVISHPDRVTHYELGQYDRVYAASRSFPGHVRSRWPDLDVRPLLQCTDPGRFYPDPDESFGHDLLFVGNSRAVLRPVVRDALAIGQSPTVFGSDWDGLIPPEMVNGTYLPNELLRRYYSSARVVLNDHWEDMKEHGFISNRLFDAVASGAVVVTDDISGLEGLFGDRVITYSEEGDLAEAIERAHTIGSDGGRAAAEVVEDHTFLARARELVAAADELTEAMKWIGR